MACKPGFVLDFSMDDHSSRVPVTKHLKQPTRTAARKTSLRSRHTSLHRPSLFGFAPGGVYRAASVTRRAVRSYRTLSPLPVKTGGLLSVALSLRSPPPAINRHRISVEPGLSSPPYRGSDHPAIWYALLTPVCSIGQAKDAVLYGFGHYTGFRISNTVHFLLSPVTLKRSCHIL